ncbi:cadherin domain-containing protein [Herbaspirillum sp. ST 5-3]|uniref:beta strand repeat-containing protein n=1 Tax=Oxalobacteraceae TaxID=75682 RepID=UPI0010A4672C|nr:cadherin domain-containing protein [Herbaspirillum sp. ST 5-3]
MAIAADYFPLVQQLYVAYFGRPADPAGLQSMADSLLANGAPTDIQAFNASYSTNVGVKTILDNFGGTESANLYGTSAENFVFSFYQNVLGRLPDAAGYSFWVESINNGTLTMGKAAISMMAGALANTTTQGQQDAAKITNMLAVADDFTAAITTESATYSGDAAAQAARDLLKTITATTDISTVQDDIVSTLYGMTNHAPSVTAATLSIAEGSAADAVVGTVTGTDPDGNVIEFAITSGNDAGYFAINATTGAITLTAAGAAALDYETATSYTLGVKAADASLSSTEQTVTINVTNANDNTPVISSGATATVAENADVATVVYQAAASDADGNTVTYSLTGADSALLDINTATGAVTLKASADFETKASYSFNVVASDGATSSSQAVTLTVTNANDAPVVTSAATATVAENADVATVVYQATATDADGNTVTYSLTGDDAALFDIDAATGAVTLKASADFETKASYTFNVVASDGTASTSQAVTLDVTNVNEAPVITSATTATVVENADVATVVYQAAASDVDGNPLTYSLAGADVAFLTVDAATGAVTLNASANFEAKASYSFDVVASDGTNTATQAVTLTVTDVNESPVVTADAVQIDDNGGANTGDLVDINFNVADPEANFNGGTLTIAATGNTFGAAKQALTFDGTNFYRVGNAIIADSALLGTTTDEVIGTIVDTYTDVTGGTAGTFDNGEANGAIITFNSARVTNTLINQLIDNTSLAAAQGASDANVTITVADASGATGSVTRLFDLNDAAAIANLGATDDREVEVANVGIVNIDATGNATFASNGSAITGGTLVVSGIGSGDTLGLVNTTNAAVASQARLIGTSVAVADGAGVETIIGTVSAAPAAGTGMTITFNSSATDALVQTLIRSLTVDLSTAIAGRAVNVTYTSGDGTDTVSNDVSLSVVGDFATKTLAALRAATTGSPVTISQNHNIEIANADNGQTADLAQMVADGKIIVTGSNLIRITIAGTETADIKGVTGFSALGSYSFTDVSGTLTLDADTISGHSATVTGTLHVANLIDTLNADLSGVSGSGTIDGTLVTTGATNDVTFTGNFGDVAVTVSGGGDLTMSAAVANGASVDNSAANVIVTGLNGAAAYDISGVTASGGSVVVAFAADTTLDAGTDLGSANLAATIAQDVTVTMTAAQATGIATAGGTLTGDNATGDGHHGGSIVVTGLTAAADLSALTAGTHAGGATNYTDGTVTTTVASNLTFTGDLGTAVVTVASGATLTGAAAVLTGETISGAGNVAVTALNATAGADLSTITVTGTKTANVAGNVTFTGNLGSFTTSVDVGATLTLSAAKATGHTIGGDNTTAGGQTGGTVVVTGLDGAAAYDLTHITAGNNTAGGTAGSLTAQVAADATLNAGTNLGSFGVTVADTKTLTLSAAQATDHTITANGTTNGGVTVNVGDSGTYDFSGITESAANATLKLHATGSISLASMDLGTLDTIAAGTAGTDAFTVTLTAAQADGLTLSENGTNSHFAVTAVTNAGAGLTITGSGNGDSLYDGEDADTIDGGAGNDTIVAAAGGDNITGGAGLDTMTGGAGDDHFIFADGDSGVGSAARDVINDFTDGGIAGGDVIDLSGLTWAGVQEFIGTASFDQTGIGNGQVRYTVTGGNAIVEIDADNDGAADMQIMLIGVDSLTGSDFLL